MKYSDACQTRKYIGRFWRDEYRFLRMVDELAHSFVRNGTDFVAGDATEGFNPTHDICRTLLNAAVSIAQHTTEGSSSTMNSV